MKFFEGHCTFEGSMCGWTNQEEGDDFDWNLGRGSDNFFTGPARDFYSFSKEYPLGGFVYIDADYPRRPGDKAILISPLIQPTGLNLFTLLYLLLLYLDQLWFKSNQRCPLELSLGVYFKCHQKRPSHSPVSNNFT